MDAQSLSLRDLTYILAVERHGSVTRAAEACDVAQPTLSTQIAKLERELGVRIFERDGRGLKVTAAGRTVLDHARGVVDAIDGLVAATREHRDPLAGTLHLGLIPTLAPYLLPHLLPAMRSELPRIALTVIEEQTAVLLERLRAGTLDAALIATDAGDDRLAETMLFDEPLWVALPVDHPLAARASVDTADIDVGTLLLLSEGHCLRDQALALCTAPGLAQKGPGDLRAASLETVLNLVEAGYGLTFVPDFCLRAFGDRRARLVVRPFTGGAARRIRLVARRSSPRGTLLAAVAGIVRTAAGVQAAPA
jgi:LysR family hydrogen peroxide-inducible transcriptional activator